MESILLLSVAILLDSVMGEPPKAIHPVVWTGTLITYGERAIRFVAGQNPRHEHHGLFFGGIMMAFLLPLALALCVWGMLRFLSSLPFLGAQFLEIMLSLFLLKSTFSIRSLFRASSCVKKHLGHHDIPRAAQALKSLCSRKTTSQEEIINGTVCSLAENTSDSIVAPILMFCFLGIPGACFYRCVNTMDAMVGYRSSAFHWLGWGAARLDDLLNIIPARLTALLFLFGNLRLPVTQGWRIMMQDAHKTPSPNSGWPMATMAGLLGVCLYKKASKGSYVLGHAFLPPTIESIGRAQKMIVFTMLAGFMLVLGIMGVMVR